VVEISGLLTADDDDQHQHKATGTPPRPARFGATLQYKAINVVVTSYFHAEFVSQNQLKVQTWQPFQKSAMLSLDTAYKQVSWVVMELWWESQSRASPATVLGGRAGGFLRLSLVVFHVSKWHHGLRNLDLFLLSEHKGLRDVHLFYNLCKKASLGTVNPKP